jgi:hypothetical protein
MSLQQCLEFWNFGLHTLVFNPLPVMMEGFACNRCSSKLHGISYRTSCCHLFCPDCAQSSFRMRKCPVCQFNLQRESICETVVGAKVADTTDQLFQTILGGSSTQESSKLLSSLFQGLQEVTSFIIVQQELHLRLCASVQIEYETKMAEKDAQIVILHLVTND